MGSFIRDTPTRKADTISSGIETLVKLQIVQAGDPVLRQSARPLTQAEIVSREIRALIESMRECMYDAPGVGLAAPQVGLSLQLAVIEDRAEYHKDVAIEHLRERERRPVPFQVIINPVISVAGAEKVEFFEGCLSVSGFTAIVARARTLRVDCLNELGEQTVIEASGWHARILQHEIDHLQGTLYIDRMHSRSFSTMENWTRNWKGKPANEIRAAMQADTNSST
jgi:peptide deformylase